jgi:hypothetical protein
MAETRQQTSPNNPRRIDSGAHHRTGPVVAFEWCCWMHAKVSNIIGQRCTLRPPYLRRFFQATGKAEALTDVCQRAQTQTGRKYSLGNFDVQVIGQKNAEDPRSAFFSGSEQKEGANTNFRAARSRLRGLFFQKKKKKLVVSTVR